jgi:hypothetical protein
MNLFISFTYINLSYAIELGVCYLVMTDRGYDKAAAFCYIKELSEHFFQQFSEVDIGTVARPYAFVKFCIYYIYFFFSFSIYL